MTSEELHLNVGLAKVVLKLQPILDAVPALSPLREAPPAVKRPCCSGARRPGPPLAAVTSAMLNLTRSQQDIVLDALNTRRLYGYARVGGVLQRILLASRPT